MNRVMYREWFPQVVYNHHQTGPPGTVLFVPPFRDPFNYYFDPLVPSGIDVVGAAMQNRFLVEGKFGATSRSGSRYSTWWNGGLRCQPKEGDAAALDKGKDPRRIQLRGSHIRRVGAQEEARR